MEITNVTPVEPVREEVPPQAEPEEVNSQPETPPAEEIHEEGTAENVDTFA